MQFDFDKKKIIALVGLLAVAGGLGYLLYYIFFKPAAIPEETAAEAGVSETLKPSEAGALNPEEAGSVSAAPIILPSAGGATALGGPEKIVAVKPIVTAPSVGLTLSAGGNGIQYYNNTDGKFYQADAEGNATPLSDQTFLNVSNVAWAPNKKTAAMNFPDGSNIIYDFAKQKQYTIPDHWSDISFSPDSGKIAGKTNSPDPNARFLFTASADGTGATPVEPLGDNGSKVIVDWSPNNQIIAFSRTAPPPGGGADRQTIYNIGKNHENFRALTVEGLDFRPQWSPTGDRVVYSAFSGAFNFIPALWVDGGTDDTIGAAKNFLNVQTWADKCAFASNDEILCAVPNPDNMPVGVGFAPWSATDTDDTVYKINIKTGLQTIIGKPNGNRTIEQMSISKNGGSLFLKDKNSGEVLTMNLK